ncbi:hypothetical protein GF395_01940, partial [Candidatus Uhrbacteria bacterium]|nr:hypothetical protein [Candidatus Uhrbacteria bacterium]
MKWGGVIGNAFELGFLQLGKIMLSTFVNTLVSKLMQNIMRGIFSPDSGGPAALPDLLNPGAAPPGSVRVEEIISEQYRDILAPKITTQEEQDLLVELEACPPAGRTKWNCAISSGVARLLRQGAVTVRQAIDGGYLSEDWELIPSTQLQDNQDPSCASRAFCVGNLRKLRQARVIPIGWELAADSPYNQIRCSRAEGCVTLGEVIRGFDDCNYDVNNGGSEEGTLDAQHPWCHLIDPNWVLTIMPAQCLLQGFGNSLLTGTEQRSADCQDTVTCMERNSEGRCIGGYGYCLAEQTHWQFEALSCREQFVSCRQFTGRASGAEPIGYLRSTIDYGSCSAENVGCMWYGQLRDPDADDIAWTADYNSTFDKVYYDSTILPCDASADGCTNLRRVEPGTNALNLVRNSSFELVDDDGNLRYWLRGSDNHPVPFVDPNPASGEAAAHGSNAIASPQTSDPVPQSGSSIHQIVRIKGLRQYTLSYYTRRYATNPASGAGVWAFALKGKTNPFEIPSRDDALASMAGLFRSDDCSVQNAGNTEQRALNVPSDVADGWQRVECSFVTPADAEYLIVYIHRVSNNPAMFDAIQLEEAEVARPYATDLNPSLATVHMRVPPEEYACQGNEDTDHPLCANYARVCRQNEAGCEGYRPVSQGTAPEVPAVLTPVDYCPAECVGYAEFRKQPSTFDFVRNPDNPLLDDPEDQTIQTFIPGTARICSAQDVGCELFTNLDALETGGEAVEAFSYLRSCEKPSDNSQTYYTWEGSEATGFQLVTWSMVRDVDAPFPQPPKVIQKAGPDGQLKDPNGCNAANYLLAIDPDCRQFYDPQGNVFYRYESQTVLADTACAQFRLDQSSQADCTKTGGEYLTETGQCLYQALAERSNSCTEAVAGCRGYIGTQGSVQTEVFNEEFSNEDYAVEGVGSGLSLSLSEESVLVGDQSLRVEGNGDLQLTVPTESGVLYELHFWARYAGSNRPNWEVSASNDTNAQSIGTAGVTNQWNVFRLGPFVGDRSGAQTTITIQGLLDINYLDKIRVERVTDVSYVIKDSWNTPASCDRTPEGLPQPQAMLGCQTYESRGGEEVNLRKFTRLCRETAIGCRAFVHTENTETPYELTWERDGELDRTEVTTKRADHYEYYIDEPSSYCPETAQGCRAFGKPKFNQDRTDLDAEEPFTTVYLQEDERLMEQGICSEPELFCEAYTYKTKDGSGTDYFRAPGNHACQWREGVVVDQACDLDQPDLYLNTTFNGWFKVGTDCPCYEDRLQRGSVFGLRYTGDPGYNGWQGSDDSQYVGPSGQPDTYQGWTATCPNSQAECTEFRDVNDKSDPFHPQGRPYYVINDQRLDEDSCGGRVDPGNGCVLFRDTSDNRLLYSSQATQIDYKDHGYSAVPALNCELNPNHPACQEDIGVCTDFRIILTQSATFPSEAFDLSQPDANAVVQDLQSLYCRDDSDCDRSIDGSVRHVQGTCVPNDTNIIVKVKPDRSCSQWLACGTGETVYDPQEGAYRSICTELTMCNEANTVAETGVPYCTSFVDREAGSDETILETFQVLDAQTYAGRPTGFGAVDYSGFSLVNQFQIMDTQLKPVGSLLTTDPSVRSRFKKDYRLGVAIDMNAYGDLVEKPQDPQNDERLEILSNVPELKQYACIFLQTGAVGLMTNNDRLTSNDNAIGTLCWLSLDQQLPPQLAGAGSAIVTDNLNVANLTVRFEQNRFPQLDQTLSRSFPNTQCKAAPESNAPFGNEFVLEWDDTVRPPLPIRTVEGYGSANFCEYGEDCACVYKRVDYGGYTKYYEPLSTDVINAICVGG